MWTRRRVVIGAAGLAAPFLVLKTDATEGAEPASFNETGIYWHSYQEGLLAAEAQDVPIYLLVHAEWCPTCRSFRSVFFDPRIVAYSTRLVFVLIDQDREAQTSQAYAPDGLYVPRSMILAPDGGLRADIHSGRSEYRYFLPVETPGPLLNMLHHALTDRG